MNGEVGNRRQGYAVDDDLDSADEADELMLSDDIDDDDIDDDIDDDDIDDDNVGDISVEINVEELVAKLEASDGDDARRRKEIHRRLEELEEQRKIERELDSTFNFNLDDEV